MNLLFKYRPLVINPELAARICLNEAIVLQHINYWLIEFLGAFHYEKRHL
ncbi:MAG: hypothetical protein ACRCUG_04010 [Yersinia sp. (in: enterobacteria)]